ncbi:MAG: TonB-dependent receptor, partial [Flavobacteriia bacterium]|nr:TonB-dependent receptor [Flavobacteriia bacterium]
MLPFLKLSCKTLFFLFFTFFVTCGYAQEKHTISGYISSASNGEALSSAKVYVPSISKGAITNNYGFYSLTLPNGIYEIEFRYTSLNTLKKTVDLTNVDVMMNIELGLKEGEREFDEVVVNGKRTDNVNSTKLGQMELSIEQIKRLPAFMGEVDVIKTIQLLPGVSSVSEGGQGFYVRGGGPDQNLVLLDEGVVYNASHLFGFFSVFNSDAIRSVNLIKGGMPANYGGRLSSVLEVNMNEGNSKRLSIKGGLGVISSRLTVEGPLKKDRGSFIVSGRRTYIDVLAKALIPDTSPFAGSGYYFYDMNAKLNYKLGDKDRIFLSGYYGKDVFSFADRAGGFSANMPWGNGIAAFRWNHLFNPKLFMNVTSTFSDYKFMFGSQQDQFKIEFKSGIQDYGTKIDFSYYPNDKHRIKWGANYIYHIFTPSSVSAAQDSVVFNTGNAQDLYSHEEAIYLMDEFDFNDRLRINAGLRYTAFQHVGPFTRYIQGDISKPDTTITYGKGDLIKFYHGLEPRFSFRYLTGENSSIKGGYAYNYQFVHLTSLSAVSLPTDIWYPTTDRAKPQKGFQASLGYFQNFKSNTYEASVEVYY